MVKVSQVLASQMVWSNADTYSTQAILKLQKQEIKTMEITQEAVDDFVEYTDKYMPRTVWSTGCRVSDKCQG
jgi:hypothetical protein